MSGSWTMNLARASRRAAAAGGLVVGLASASAWAAPPINDDYLQSIRIVDRAGRVPGGNVQDIRDTTDATVQSDLFAPESVGGGAEPGVTPAACGGVGYGKTIWYDFMAPKAGAVELRASGPENVLVLYKFDRTTSVLGARVACTGPGSGTELVQAVEAGVSYTVQVGGVDRGLGPAVGPVTFGFELFVDADVDGVLDALDKCPDHPGLERYGGCPATVTATTSMNLVRDGGGKLSLTPLTAKGPAGTRIAIRCHRRCAGRWFGSIGPSGRTTLRDLGGVRVVLGSQIDVYLTRRGFFGRFLRYQVVRSGLMTSRRCLLPVKNPKPRKRCGGAGPAS